MPRWREVREFCRRQGYRETRTDHFHYLKLLPDGSTSGTMVSMGKDSQEVPARMWSMVWRRQLRLASEDEFWRGLRGEPVEYATTVRAEATQPLPDYLVRFLKDVAHHTDDEIAATTREQAQQELNDYYSRELRNP